MRRPRFHNTLRGVARVVPLASILATSPVLASDGEEQVPVGPRPLSMGGAYTAIAEGPDALYWNPAGLADLSLSTFRATQADLHGLGIDDNVLSLVSPAFGRFGFGLEWYRSGYSDEVFEDALDRFGLGVGWRPLDRIQVGTTLRYRRYRQTFGGEDQGTGAGFGLDLGLLVRPTRDLRVGLSWMDLGGSTLEFDDGTTATPYGQTFRFGAAYHVRPEWTLAADLGRDVHLGTEVRIVDALSLRTGWMRDRDGLDDGRLTAGMSVRIGPAVVEYAFQDHPALDPTHHFGLNLDFSLAPRLVDVRDARLDPIFASFYKTYARTSAGELIVENLHDEALEIELRLENDTLIPAPARQTVVLRPGVAQRIDLKTLLGPAVLDLREPTPSDFRLSIRYLSKGRTRTDGRDLRTIVYEPGTLSWGEGVARAAAFITPTHRVVEDFARRLLDSGALDGGRFLNRTSTTAALLFNGLSGQGFAYTPDPLNPFASVQGDAVAVDDIQYPIEMLQSRRGDCDDMSVLYASLLESVGVRTALVDVPGHIFVLFDTGLPERDRRLTGYAPELFVVRGGTLWVPVETTRLGEPFHAAWEAGADLFERWSAARRARVVDVLDARSTYEAAVYGAPGDDENVTVAVDADAVLAMSRRDHEVLAQWREEALRATPAGPDALDAEAGILARVFFLNQDYERAAAELESVPERRRDGTTWNNLGASRLAAGRLDAALAALTRARTLAPDDPGIALNRGLGLHLHGDHAASRRELGFAVRGSRGVDGILELLGVRTKPAVEDTRADQDTALDQMTLERIRELLEAALLEVPPLDSTAVDSTRTLPPPPVATPREDGERVIAGGQRAGALSTETIGTLLYWRDPTLERSDP